MIVAEAVVTTSSDNIVLALIGVISLAVGALVFVVRNGRDIKETRDVAKDTNNQIAEVNKAVNNIGPGEHRLYDKVTHILGEIVFIKENVENLNVQMNQHKIFWEEFHERWGTATHAAFPDNEIAVTLKKIQEEVSQFHTILEGHIEKGK